MVNLQERYGRPGIDEEIPIPEVTIIGRRTINEPVKDMIPPHTLKYFQLIYVEKGEMEVWVNGRILNVHEKELVVIQPYEAMAFLRGVMSRGSHCFIQIDKHPVGEPAVSSVILSRLTELLEHPTPKVLKIGSAFHRPFTEMMNEIREGGEWSRETSCSWFRILCVNLIRYYEEKLKATNPPENSAEILDTVDEYIATHLHSEISIFDLAGLTGFSENHFRVQFKRITDMAPLKYINMKRVDAARKLLIESRKPVTEIAFELGFSSSQYFSTFFKKQTSFTPDEFRREISRLLEKNVKKIVTAKEAAAQLDKHFNKFKGQP